MIFTDVIERDNSFTIDGYSNRKTIKGAIKEFGKYIAKNYSEAEGNNLIEYQEECIQEPSQEDVRNGLTSYFFTIEEVPCASKLNHVTDEIEYSEANYYLCIRIIK